MLMKDAPLAALVFEVLNLPEEHAEPDQRQGYDSAAKSHSALMWNFMWRNVAWSPHSFSLSLLYKDREWVESWRIFFKMWQMPNKRWTEKTCTQLFFFFYFIPSYLAVIRWWQHIANNNLCQSDGADWRSEFGQPLMVLSYAWPWSLVWNMSLTMFSQTFEYSSCSKVVQVSRMP